ncbi:MAG: hypothetical protein HYZ57_01600 [Acidobacteria bacterium]|nr:hypothetical protein [Acidobacteriota bacterium]MBI3278518.1 hypothetical protein [Acidobacteriota bacterium]
MLLASALERLAASGIQLLPAFEIASHWVFERGGFVALVERRGENLGSAGSAGLLTEKGMAALIWRGGRAFFVAKGYEQAATDEQVQELRRFQSDLEAALR